MMLLSFVSSNKNLISIIHISVKVLMIDMSGNINN